jgi:quercetin dioxygenase-like cupin family protein
MIFSPAELTTTRQAGVAETTLADRALLGSDALHVEQITLDPGVRTQPARVSDGEYFVYVVSGAGQAHVGTELLPLEPETILWLEPGDTYTLEAGAHALVVLLCRAPAGSPDPLHPSDPLSSRLPPHAGGLNPI